MRRDNIEIRNMCSLIDAVDFVICHKDKLTSTEKDNLTNPLIVSRTVFRRVLGKAFVGFEIRKNSDNYSIRCAEPSFYIPLKLSSMMRDINAQGILKFSPALYKQITEELLPSTDFLALFSSNSALQYKFRDDNRFFMYINYMPYTNFHVFDFDNSHLFETHRMSSRLNNMMDIQVAAEKVNTSPLIEKVFKFIVKFSTWSIGYIPRSSFVGGITEEFIDYAMVFPIGSNLITIISNYIALSDPKAIEQKKAAEAAELLRFEEIARAKLIADRTRFSNTVVNIPRPLTPILSRVEPTDNDSEVRVRVVPTTTPATTQQGIFQEALNRVISSRNDERYLRVSIVESEPLEAFREEPASLSALYDTNYPEINESEYIRLSDSIPELEELRTIFTPFYQDVLDDLDLELHGVYFKVNSSDIQYLVYVENKVILDTQDLNTALSLYTSLYGKVGEIRYLEDIENVRH